MTNGRNFDDRGWDIDVENKIGFHKIGMTMGFTVYGKNVKGIIANHTGDEEEIKNLYVGGCMSFVDSLIRLEEMNRKLC